MSLADRLTPRQLDIARLIARGLLGKEVAAELGTSYATVRAHIYNPGGIFERLGARSNVDVARAVWREEGMGDEPTEGKPQDYGWQVRQDAIHWLPEALPAGEHAWTDYSGDDCQLRRRKPDDRSNPVRVTEPLFPADRIKVKASNGEWVAERVR